jgi:hypothetical protein
MLGADLDSLAAELSRARLDRFDPAALLWLAAFPEWSYQLAGLADFPAGNQPLSEFIARLAAAGLAEQREVLNPSGEVSIAFWLPASRRGEVGEYLRSIWPAAGLLAEIDKLARTLQGVPELTEPSGTRFLPALKQWLQVAQTHRADPSGARLIDAVDELVAEERSTEALSLVAAAQALGEVLGDPLAASARRAQWRVDRAYRQTLDARTLVHYMPQPEVDEALAALLRGNGGWAIHLLGDGGVGKTMALRDLAAGHFADRLGLARFPVARIDFDHLDPRYPQRRPVEVLIALAGELAGFTTTRDAHYGMRRFDSAAAYLHEVLAGPTQAPAEGDAADGADEMRLLATAVDAFADYVSQLGERVVLVLDTCEELAKVHARGGRAPAVDRTFEILERIHNRSSAVRVVLAGRRPLIPPPDGAPVPFGLVLSARPYLSVLPLAGFSAAMTESYVDWRDPQHLIRSALRAAVIDRCLPPGESTANPFDLACYVEWALAEPDMDADRLRSATGDPYVEQRIIGRLTDTAVRDCLGVAVELGRFEPEMIEPALMRRGIDPSAAFSGLIGQEWVSAVSFDNDGRPQVIEVSEHLLPRLRRVVAADPDRFLVDRVQLGRDQAALIDASRQVDELPIEAIEAALRLLPPSESAAMWAELELRIAESDAWGWAAQAIPRAAAAEAERAAAGGPTVLAAILATQAAGTLRQPGRTGLDALWADVDRLASRHPDSAVGEQLAARSICGRIAADPEGRDRAVGILQLHDVAHRVPQGSLIAALDALTAGGEPLDSILGNDLDALCEQESTASEVRAASFLARASSRLAVGRVYDAVADVEMAMASADPGSGSQGWVDWLVPPRLLDRARLARVVLASIHHEPAASLPLVAWRDNAFGHLSNIDAERLVAASLQLELDWQLVDRAVLRKAIASETYIPERQPTHHWHRGVEPLCATLSRGSAAVGDFAAAVQALQDRRKAAVRAGEDPLTISTCELVLVELCRIFRTTRPASSIDRLAREAAAGIRSQAWATLALVRGESPARPDEAGGVHAWWQAQIRRPGQPLPSWSWQSPTAETIDNAGSLLPPEDVDSLEAETDASSSGRLAAERSMALDTVLRLGHLDVRWPRGVFGAVLRANALAGQLDHMQVEALPPRWAALTAMAEGELLALRKPETGAELLAFAARLFLKSGDVAAAAQAHVLQVLAVTRAGGDPQATQLPKGLSLSAAATKSDDGWRLRVRLAQSLLEGRPLAERFDNQSPELDPRPLEPELPAPSPLSSDGLRPTQSTETASTDSRRDIGNDATTVSVGNLPVLKTRPGHDTLPLSSRMLLLSRRYTQRTVGIDSRSPERLLFAQVTPTASALQLAWYPLATEQDLSPVRNLHLLTDVTVTSARQYVVFPLLTTDNEDSRAWEQELGGLTPEVAGRRPLWMRLDGSHRWEEGSITWRLGAADHPEWTHAGIQFHGPRNLAAELVIRAPEKQTSSNVFAVVHLFGTPVPTVAGWRMRVATAETQSGPLTTRAELLGPDDLPAARTALVVLQAEPIDGPPRPLEDQRQGMCALARELRAAGAGSVLVVPPLPDMLAGRAVAEVSRAMIRERVHPARVLDLVNHLRSLIRASSEAAEVSFPEDIPAPGDIAVAWLDLLLFV